MKSLKKIPDRHLSFLMAFLVFFGVFLIFLPVVLFGIYQVVNRGETRYTQMEVNRSENILQNELTQLDQLMHGISSWDDTYQFVQDKNQAYIENNLADAVFASVNVDMWIALNNANEVVYAKYFNSTTQAGEPFPFDLQSFLQVYPSLLVHPDLHTGQNGIAFFAGHPLLVAARPIVTSQELGPAHGTLIFGRFLNADELDAISQLTQRKINLMGASGASQKTPGLPAASTLKDQVFVQTRDSETNVGYKYLKDLNTQPSLILQVDNPRDLYHQGVTTAWVFTGALVILGFGLFLATYQLSLSFLKSRKAGQRYLKRFQTVVDQSRDAMLLISPDFHVLQVNPACRQLLDLQIGKTQAAFLKSILSLEPDLDEKFLYRSCQSGAISEHHCIRRDGLELELELSASLIADAEVQAFSITLHDVTARKKAENALRISEERYMFAANGSNDGLWDWNLMSDEIYYSARWKTMLGYAEDEIGSEPEEWFDRVHLEDLVQLRTQLSDHLRNRTEHFECEYRIAHKNNQFRWMLARGVAVWDPAGYASRMAGSQTDITDRKLIEEQLRYDALHDALTGLSNRTLLLDHLNHVNERKKRKPDLLFALFFLDLDHFKQVNDSFGHQVGDQLLVEAAQRMEKGLRSIDTISRFTGLETLARIAGDEFVILLEDFNSLDDIQKVTERVTELLSAPYSTAGKEVSLPASIGLVVPDQPYDNVDDIIRDADIAMYQAKQLGGGKVVRFIPEMFQDTLLRMQTESELRQAVERHEFEVYYQPIYTLNNDRIAGFEALARWNHPERGFLLPAEFIHIAEENGLIIPIGYFVLEEACRTMQDWSQRSLISPELVMSVNLSARQIMKADLVEQVCSILSSTGYDPKKLWLEVTESALVENNETVLSQLKELRAMGIRIEIDDFGTGYSSLSYLQNLPVDGFKIDQSFVKDINEDGHQIVKTLIELGRSLGLTEVAEGIETDRQLEYLKTMSCHYAQGFLMSRPISAKAIEELLKNSPPIDVG